MTGTELQQWREGHGLSVAEMAAALDVNRLTINRLESGESRVTRQLELALKGLLFSHCAEWYCCCQQCNRKRKAANDPRELADPFVAERAIARVANARAAKRARLAVSG